VAAAHQSVKQHGHDAGDNERRGVTPSRHALTSMRSSSAGWSRLHSTPGAGRGSRLEMSMGPQNPITPWGIPLLGLGYGLKQIPMGIDLGEIPYPSGMAGTGLGGLNPNPITHG
jgi:hypothetical protein